MHRLLSASLVLITSLLCSTAAWAHSGDAKPTRRWALLWSAEDGGAGRARLRYAHTDAAGLGRVWTQLGGVDKRDMRLLHNPKIAQLHAEMAAPHAELKAAQAMGHPTQVVFYYSGHSDERGLLLGAERFEYQELRSAIEALPADVR